MNVRQKRVALVVVGLAVGAGLAEGVARLASATPAEELLFRAPAGALRGLYEPDAALLNVPVPGYAGTLAAPGYRVDVRIDDRGLRVDPDAAAAAPTGPTWLAVGDSFTLSLQVDVADSFEARLGEALGVSVLNAGVDGYSTWQSLERWRRLDPVVGSDTVLLTYFLGNDLTDDEVYPLLAGGASQPSGPGRGPPPAGTPGAPPPGPPPGGADGAPPKAEGLGLVEGLLFRHSRLYAYLRVAQARRALTRPDNMEAQKFKNELVAFTRGGKGRLDQLVAGSQVPLTQLRDATRQRGDRLLVAVAPPSFAVSPTRAADTLGAFGLTDPDADAPRRAMLALLERLGVPACDLTPALSAAESAGQGPYLRFDGHWTPAGHAVVAEALAACARREGWIGP